MKVYDPPSKKLVITLPRSYTFGMESDVLLMRGICTHGDGDGVDGQRCFYIELDGPCDGIRTEKAWSLLRSCDVRSTEDGQGCPGFVLVDGNVPDMKAVLV